MPKKKDEASPDRTGTESITAESMAAPAADFDVRAFARTAAGNHRDDLNLSAYVDAPLTPQTLRALAYLRDIERATMSHLRGVLVTATHKDARVTAFLTTWAFEKFWIADALDAVVAAHDETEARPETVIRTAGEHTVREAIIGNIVGVPMTAVHMTEGTVDEWVMQTAYSRIAQLQPHHELERTIALLLEVKERQLLFFEAQARYRLLHSPRSRSVTRRNLAKTSWPIGARAQPKADTRFFYDYLFLSAPETITMLDARIDTLPGQAGLGLIGKAAKA
ncbi:MAG: hypothetical protein V4479_15345 [Actinomycetota bacterium]